MQALLREVFEDTADFASLRTNAQGQATHTFRLPHNITSWRLTTSGVTTDLYAGNNVQNIIVTNRMFVHYSLSDTFLVGDRPTMGVNVYGTGLTGDERVNFEVWSEAVPEEVLRASGVAFERVNIPLREMTKEGEHALIIQATTSNGLNDAVRHSYRVVNSHRLVDIPVFYNVTRGTVFEAGRQGLTNITFTDAGRGQFLYELLGMRRVRGASSPTRVYLCTTFRKSLTSISCDSSSFTTASKWRICSRSMSYSSWYLCSNF